MNPAKYLGRCSHPSSPDGHFCVAVHCQELQVMGPEGTQSAIRAPCLGLKDKALLRRGPGAGCRDQATGRVETGKAGTWT